jgi:hypothetical protein
MSNRDNPRRGSNFEDMARIYFRRKGIILQKNVEIMVGASNKKKIRRFDLGSKDILVECKNHSWTESDNSPSAKLTIWNEAMYYFYTAPKHYRKILFVKETKRDGISLGHHYINRYSHMIPKKVELWEFNPKTLKGKQIYIGK